MSPDTVSVDLFVDPICPFAWLTSRWLANVEQQRPVDVSYRVMSLSVLNDGRPDLPDFYRDLVGRGWGPARVAIAVDHLHGRAALRRYYEEFGTRRHVAGRDVTPELVTEALLAAGLPAELAAAAAGTDFDELLRVSHHAGMDPVGDEVGTPTLHVRQPGCDPVAFFGPVVTTAPTGDAALRLWDGVLAVTGIPVFFELKRSRNLPLVFA